MRSCAFGGPSKPTGLPSTSFEIWVRKFALTCKLAGKHLSDMSSNLSSFVPVLLLFEKDPVARPTFDLLAKNPGISGLGVARILGKNPEIVEQSIRSLRDYQLVNPGGDSLRDNLALTGSGYLLRQNL